MRIRFNCKPRNDGKNIRIPTKIIKRESHFAIEQEIKRKM